MSELKTAEAAQYLGISDRTLIRYKNQGRLHPIYRAGPKGQEAYYLLEELQALKEQRETPLHMSEVVRGDSSLSEVVRGQDEALLIIVEKLIELAAIREARSPLATYRELEEAAERGWILPTSVVRDLTGIRPKGLCSCWGCFGFQRSGKMGREAGWRVKKI